MFAKDENLYRIAKKVLKRYDRYSASRCPEYLNIEDDVLEIGEKAFQGAGGLRHLTIP